METSDPLLQRVSTALFAELPHRQSRITIGVSGGSDSAAIAHMLSLLAPLALQICYVNHNLRSPDELAEEFEAVESLAEMVDVAMVRRDIDKEEFERISASRGWEAAARQLRYDELVEVAHSGDGILVTAHHQDDVAEWALMHILSGRSVMGTAMAIPRRSKRVARNGREVLLIRPALALTKLELASYAEENRLPFVLDRTNADERFRRNRIRHTVLPQLRETYSSVTTSLANHATEVALLRAAVETMIPQDLGGRIEVERFGNMPEALRNLVLREMAYRVSARARLDFAPFTPLVQDPSAFTNGDLIRSGDVDARVKGGWIELSRVVRRDQTGYLLVVNQAVFLRWEQDVGIRAFPMSGTTQTPGISIGVVHPPVVIRTIHPGDMITLGKRSRRVTTIGGNASSVSDRVVMEDREGVVAVINRYGVQEVRDGTTVVRTAAAGPEFAPPLYFECEDDS